MFYCMLLDTIYILLGGVFRFLVGCRCCCFRCCLLLVIFIRAISDINWSIWMQFGTGTLPYVYQQWQRYFTWLEWGGEKWASEERLQIVRIFFQGIVGVVVLTYILIRTNVCIVELYIFVISIWVFFISYPDRGSFVYFFTRIEFCRGFLMLWSISTFTIFYESTRCVQSKAWNLIRENGGYQSLVMDAELTQICLPFPISAAMILHIMIEACRDTISITSIHRYHRLLAL